MIFLINKISKKLIYKYSLCGTEVFKKTLENARPYRTLKPGSKSVLHFWRQLIYKFNLNLFDTKIKII